MQSCVNFHNKPGSTNEPWGKNLGSVKFRPSAAVTFKSIPHITIVALWCPPPTSCLIFLISWVLGEGFCFALRTFTLIEPWLYPCAGLVFLLAVFLMLWDTIVHELIVFTDPKNCPDFPGLVYYEIFSSVPHLS